MTESVLAQASCPPPSRLRSHPRSRPRSVLVCAETTVETTDDRSSSARVLAPNEETLLEVAHGACRCDTVRDAYHWSLMGAHLAPRLVGIWRCFLSRADASIIAPVASCGDEPDRDRYHPPRASHAPRPAREAPRSAASTCLGRARRQRDMRGVRPAHSEDRARGRVPPGTRSAGS